MCISRTTRYPTEIPIWAYKLRKLSSRNGTVSQIGVLKWKLIFGARTHSLRSKLTGRERPAPSNRLSSWVWIPHRRAKVSRVGIINKRAGIVPCTFGNWNLAGRGWKANDSQNTSVQVRRLYQRQSKPTGEFQWGRLEIAPLGIRVTQEHVLNTRHRQALCWVLCCRRGVHWPGMLLPWSPLTLYLSPILWILHDSFLFRMYQK